jgi:hypothetical protein
VIGASGLLTASFVRQAKALSRNGGKPLVLQPARKPEKILYVYRQEPSDACHSALKPFAPPPPRRGGSAFRSLGHRLETNEEIERVCIQEGLEPHDLDKRLNGFGWQDAWDNFTGPQAKAYHLLKKLDLGDADSKLGQAGEIIFEEFGGGPVNSYTWVELKDDLTVSLLQARIVELNLPINVKIAGLLRDSACSCRAEPRTR